MAVALRAVFFPNREVSPAAQQETLGFGESELRGEPHHVAEPLRGSERGEAPLFSASPEIELRENRRCPTNDLFFNELLETMGA